MYVKKEIREFIDKMPKEMKKPKHWRKFINKNDIPFNLIIKSGKEYKCTNCGKHFYKNKLNDNYKAVCPFCDNMYNIRWSNLKWYHFCYDVAFLYNIENKLVISYYEVRRSYDYKTKSFEDNIVEYARIVPELDVELASDRFFKFMWNETVYHSKKNKKWRVLNSDYGLRRYYKSIYLDNIEEQIKNTIYEYAPILDAIIYKGTKSISMEALLEKAKYQSFELLMKLGLFELALDCPEKFNVKGNFEKRFGIGKEYYKFMKKHNITYEELMVLKSIQRPNIRIIRNIIKWASTSKERIEKLANIVNLIDLMEYSKNQKNFSLYNYEDYIENIIKLGKPLINRELFPKDFMKAHDESVKKVKVIQDKETKERIKTRYNELKKNEYSNNIFLIRPAKSLLDMKQEAEQMSNCVYTNYSGRYARGETDIYFMRNVKTPEKSLVTIEVNNGRIRQKYQKYNRLTTVEQNKFIDKWAEEVLKVA